MSYNGFTDSLMVVKTDCPLVNCHGSLSLVTVKFPLVHSIIYHLALGQSIKETMRNEDGLFDGRTVTVTDRSILCIRPKLQLGANTFLEIGTSSRSR
jgi:hypothetical protein